jgi:hypothetical protein
MIMRENLEIMNTEGSARTWLDELTYFRHALCSSKVNNKLRNNNRDSNSVLDPNYRRKQSEMQDSLKNGLKSPS